MTARRSAMFFSYSTLGLFTLVGAFASQALGDDATPTATSQHHQAESDKNKPANELVKIVRQVTAKYRDVEVAESDDYNLLFGCVSGDDSGAMGLHYVNLGLYMDGKVNAYEPEIVIYEPTASGRPRLIGADYIVDAAAWDATHTQAPEPNGQIFHYFPAPNRFGLDAFYTLHVWAWKDNPTGTFVNWHENVSCDAFDGPSK